MDQDIAVAQRLYDQACALSNHIPGMALGDSFWNILLFLFIHQNEVITVSQVVEGGLTYQTTGKRHIDRLQQMALIKRVTSKEDRRVVHVELQPAGVHLVQSYLSKLT